MGWFGRGKREKALEKLEQLRGSLPPVAAGEFRVFIEHVTPNLPDFGLGSDFGVVGLVDGELSSGRPVTVLRNGVPVASAEVLHMLTGARGMDMASTGDQVNLLLGGVGVTECQPGDVLSSA